MSVFRHNYLSYTGWCDFILVHNNVHVYMYITHEFTEFARLTPGDFQSICKIIPRIGRCSYGVIVKITYMTGERDQYMDHHPNELLDCIASELFFYQAHDKN